MAILSVPKLGIELLEFLGPLWAVPGLIMDCYISMWYKLCNKLWFRCCWAGNGHGFWFHQVELILGEWVAHGKPTARFWDN